MGSSRGEDPALSSVEAPATVVRGPQVAMSACKLSAHRQIGLCHMLIMIGLVQ